MKNDVKFVDLNSQYIRIKSEIDFAIQSVLNSGEFINGIEVGLFANELEKYLKVKHVIPCANGTDALQIALMSLELNRGDEIIVPSFTYVACAEVIRLLGYKPVFVEVDSRTFTISIPDLVKKISQRTKVIIPVHLFGQCAQMEEILKIVKDYNLYCIEDTAQAIGAKYTNSNGNTYMAGSMGTFGTTSFFPSKNLGCYGDGGALFTNDDQLAKRAKMIANHGQKVKYIHEIVGCNSRLDSIQAAVLRVKLKYLNEFTKARQKVAEFYNNGLKDLMGIQTPFTESYTSHVFNQYTIVIEQSGDINVEEFRYHLRKEMHKIGVPSVVYYPVPVHLQAAYLSKQFLKNSLPITENLTKSVLSLPMHTEINRLGATKVVNAFNAAYNHCKVGVKTKI